MIEIIVAISIVTIVMIAGFLSLTFTQSTTAQQANSLEASQLATKYEELFQSNANQTSGNVSPGTYTYTDVVNHTTFTTTVSFAVEDPSGTSTAASTLCTSNSDTETGEVWAITAEVTWSDMVGAAPIIQTTYIAPGKAGAESLSDASVAAAIDGANGLPLSGTTINFVISEVQEGSGGSGAPALPNSGQTNYSTNDGCAEVDDLVADANWDYELTISGNPGWVSSQELSDLTPTQANTGALDVSAGEVAKYNGAPIELAKGQTETISLQPIKYGCSIPSGTPSTIPASCDSASFAAAAGIPVSVVNADISTTDNAYTFGSGTTTPTSMLLYPYSSGYSVFAGDAVQSEAGWTGYGSNSGSMVAIDVTSGGSGAISVPVYDVSVSTTSAAPIYAVEQGGAGYKYQLTSQGGNIYSAGLPLGQYELESGSTPLTPSPFVWVTPNGWFASATSSSTPPTGTPSTGNIPS